MSCGVGHRRGLDLALLWLWCKPAATAPVRLLAWEPPYAQGATLKKKKKKKEPGRVRAKTIALALWMMTALHFLLLACLDLIDRLPHVCLTSMK